MNFRGQDIENKFQFNNPNTTDQTNEYIENLQQQLHFMDLEFQILREKVMEDEKKSNIGSLYDDDKTSHQHISLLKLKYAKMLKDFQKFKAQLDKRMLEVQGEAFVLKATVSSSRTSIDLLKRQYEEFKDHAIKEFKELNKKVGQLSKEREALDLDVHTNLKNEFDRQSKTRFDHKMHLDKDKAFEDTLLARHTLETLEMEKLKKIKEEEKKKLEGLYAAHLAEV